MNNMASKLAFKALVMLAILGSQLGHALPLRRALGQDPMEMTGGSSAAGMKPTTAAAEATAGDGDEKILPLLVRLAAGYIATHFPSYFVPPSCLPGIAKHCGWKVSLNCLKEGMSKCK
ncbi:unnamed protein product [Urochloa humidicola]